MKTVINANEFEFNTHTPIHFINSFEDIYQDSDREFDGDELLAKISVQLDAIYKANQKRKYLLKEISNYIVKK